MKKVVVLWSSPNKDGLTASAKDQFVKGLTEAGTELEGIIAVHAETDGVHAIRAVHVYLRMTLLIFIKSL